MWTAAGLALIWALLGWLVGALAARVAAVLLARDGEDPNPSLRWPRLGLLGADPVMQAGMAAAFAVLVIVRGPELALLVDSFYAATLILVLVVDARTRYVYMHVAIPGIVLGVILTPIFHGEPLWSGLVGAAIGAALFAVIRLVGRLIYRAEAVWSGDVTIAAMIGAMTGSSHVIAALLVGILLGGVVAIATSLARRTLKGTMAYGPALCLAALIEIARR